MSERTILVVDDDASTREAYSAILADSGYRVIEAAHGGEAILHIHRDRPDAVIMDINMPVLGGVETVESIRSYPPTADMPILAVTGGSSEAEEARMQRLCDDLVRKPCSPRAIIARIDSLVDRAG